MRGRNRRNVLDVLLRVRRIERDRYALAHQQSEQEKRETRADALAAAERARIAAEGLHQTGQAGAAAAIWRALAAGVEALHAGATAGAAKLATADASEAQARARRVAAEQKLSGLERLAERRASVERTDTLRAEQRRLDESALRRRSGLCMALLFAATLTSVGSIAENAGAEVDSRVGGASLDRLLSDIRTRTKELERRENDLDERERGVAALERAVTARISELNTVSERIENRIAEWEESHGAKSVSKLAKIYGEMPPPLAAGLVEELDLELATAVLAKMKPKQSAALLPLLSEPRALSISRFVGHPLGITPTPPEPEATQ